MLVRDKLIECGRTLYQRGLVWGNSGNISIRIDQDTFLINATGANIGELKYDDLITCRLNEDRWEGIKRPSMETGFHRGIYLVCEKAMAVVHSQPFYTTLVACSDIILSTDLLPESMVYLGNIARVPYAHAGSPELAKFVTDRAKESQVMLLNNHGAVVWAPNLDEVLLKTETLELLCRMVVTAQAGNIHLKYLGQEKARDFIKHLRRISGQSEVA